MPFRLFSIAAGMILTACASASGQPGAPASAPASITYSTGPCFGACPVYSVTVRGDGTGVFTGERFTAVTGQRDFTLSRQQFAAFADMLVAHRPEGREEITHGHPRCRMVATDMPSAEVTWNDAEGPDTLSYYFGCRDPENETLAEALRDAPRMLPIEGFIGTPASDSDR